MITCLLTVSVLGGKSQAQDLLSNVYGRDYRLLNGKWGAIVDLYDQGERMQVYKNRKPQDNKQFLRILFRRRFGPECTCRFQFTNARIEIL